MYKYSSEFGSYYLRSENGEIIFMTDEVSVLFDSDGYVLLKHGRPEAVESYRKKMVDAYNKSGLQDYVKGLTILTGKFAVDDLNRILDTVGYIEVLLKKIAH